MYTPIKREPKGFINEMASPRTPQPSSLSRELKQVLRERNLLTAKTRDKVCHMLAESPGSTPYSKQPRNPEANKLKEFRLQAVQEIVDSEHNYLSQLEILMKYFVVPIKEKNLIDETTHSAVFGQIEMIYNLNKEFLRQLESNLNNVAPAFLKMAPFFKIYSVYAFDYRNALIKLQECYSNKQAFRKYVELTESRPEVQRKLNSLMIIPIQRVPRYRLLLEQLLLYTSPAESDFKILKESVKLIENTISHINSCVEDQEVTQFLINLQNSLVNHMPSIVKPSRKVIKEGVLNKATRKGTERKRYCVLMSDIFMYCKIHKERAANTVVDNSLECCCIFPLKKCKVYELFPGTFKVTCQGDGAIFSTNDLHLASTWVAFIRDAIDLHVQCRKTLRKESSKRKPMRKKDLKNFENEYILSPSKRKCDFESVYRTANESDDENDTTNKCFLRNTLSRITEMKFLNKDPRIPMKRKSSQPIDANYELHNLKEINQSSRNSKNNLEILYEKSRCMFKKQTNTKNDLFSTATASSTSSSLAQTNINCPDYDNTYGFASRYSDTTSYFRAHNVDNTIPTASNIQAILKEGGIGNDGFQDVLYPLRLSGGKGVNTLSGNTPTNNHHKEKLAVSSDPIQDNKMCYQIFVSNRNHPNSWVYQSRENSEFILQPQKKRVKFEGISDDPNESVKHKKEEILARPFAYNYPEEKQNNQMSLGERLSKFFSNLWFTAFK